MVYKPEESVFQTTLFKLSLSIPLLAGTIFGFIILANTPLESNWTANGFNHFLDIMKFPIGVMALAIPLAALVLSNYRSIQTAAQIGAQTSQNNFINYYKHLEEFEKYFENAIRKSDLHGKFSQRKVHDMVFEGARNGDYAPSIRFLRNIKLEISSIVWQLENELKYAGEDKLILTERFNKLGNTLRVMYDLIGYEPRSYALKIPDININLSSKYINQIERSLTDILHLLHEIHKFSSVNVDEALYEEFMKANSLATRIKEDCDYTIDFSLVHKVCAIVDKKLTNEPYKSVVDSFAEYYATLSIKKRYLLEYSVDLSPDKLVYILNITNRN